MAKVFEPDPPRGRSDANMIWRTANLKRLAADVSLEAEEIDRCRDDLLYWVNAYVWIAEQRKGKTGARGEARVKIPFATWDFQDATLTRMNEALGAKIVVGDKSRDMGFTWMVLALFLHRWLFFEYQSLAVASRTQELVDEFGSPDSLFWKLTFMLDNLPEWMRPPKSGYKRTKNQLVNKLNGSDIKGYATTRDIARGGRRLAIMLDELAAFPYVKGIGAWSACVPATDSIFAVSTHRGTVGAFWDACETARQDKIEDSHVYIVLRWWQDPRKNEGFVKTVDPQNPVPGMSDWTLQERVGMPWSPWYERECRRFNYNKPEIAKEVDGDASATDSPFFSRPQIDACKELCRPPLYRGRLIFDRETLEPLFWQDDPKGPMMLWSKLVGDRPQQDDYGAGCDISTGSGVTPSVLAMLSLRRGEKMAEYANAFVSADEFARDAVAYCKWFHEAQLIWEINGAGWSFWKVVRDRGYRHFYRRRTNEDKLVPDRTAMAGFHTTAETKRTLLEEFRAALGHLYVERSELVLYECDMYRYALNGNEVEHRKAVETQDGSTARKNHGDRVIASALAWRLVQEAKLYEGLAAEMPTPPVSEAPEGSLAWLQALDEQERLDSEMYGGLQF